MTTPTNAEALEWIARIEKFLATGEHTRLEDRDRSCISTIRAALQDKWMPIEHCPKTPDKFYDLHTVDGDILFQCVWEHGAWTHDIFDGNPPYTDKGITHYRVTDMNPPTPLVDGKK